MEYQNMLITMILLMIIHFHKTKIVWKFIIDQLNQY